MFTGTSCIVEPQCTCMRRDGQQTRRTPMPRTTYTHLQCRSKGTAQCLGVAAASSTAARPQGKLVGCSHRRPGRAALCRAKKGGLQCRNPRCGCTHLHSMTVYGQLTINTLLHFMPPLDCHRCTVPLALPHTRCHTSGLCSDSNKHAMSRQRDEVEATAPMCVWCVCVPESSSQAVHSCTTPHWLALLSAKQCLPRRRVLHSPSHEQASHLRSHGREEMKQGLEWLHCGTYRQQAAQKRAPGNRQGRTSTGRDHQAPDVQGGGEQGNSVKGWPMSTHTQAALPPSLPLFLTKRSMFTHVLPARRMARTNTRKPAYGRIDLLLPRKEGKRWSEVRHAMAAVRECCVGEGYTLPRCNDPSAEQGHSRRACGVGTALTTGNVAACNHGQQQYGQRHQQC